MREGIDVARAIFVNPKGYLRCGWRVCAFALAFLATDIILSNLLEGVGSLFPSLAFLVREPGVASELLSGREVCFLITSQLVVFASAIIATSLSARLLERRSLGSVGFKFHKGWFRDFALGSALGAASLAATVVVVFAGGAVRFEVPTARDASIPLGLGIAFVFMFIAGATEELLFRGFAFQALAHDLGPIAALVGASLLFGLAHVSNPSATVFSIVNTICAGIWLGTAYLLTRSLWLATSLHYSWNMAQSFLFGLPVSGFTTLNRLSLLNGRPGSPYWLSGLDYGPEGGAAATVALIASTLLIWKSGLFSTSFEMKDVARPATREPIPSVVPREDVQL
jgi:membrane protease YdiL (CAAX protease family)